METLFWILVSVILYTFIGYGLVVYVFVQLKKELIREPHNAFLKELPEVTLFVPAYNEREFIAQKVANCMSLNYPKEKLKLLFVTDGSTDGTEQVLKEYENVSVLHQEKRRGKIGAINRGMQHVNTPIVIFTDANTMLNTDAVLNICKRFSNLRVGCVAGEKRILKKGENNSVGEREEIYGKYESFLKQMDSELNTVVGTAGEMFAVRTELFHEMESDTILDDFMISMEIASKGYKVVYEKDAYTYETASLNIFEELKRKVRISAGGIQSIIRLRCLLDPFRYGLLTWQYISHHVLRWTVVPFLLIVLFVVNIVLFVNQVNLFYYLTMFVQILFYLLGTYGFLQRDRQLTAKVVHVPFYFMMTNYAIIQGIVRFLEGKQSVLWERAVRGG